MNNRSETRLSRLFKWVYIADLALLLFSGFGQMPLFKRYYLADLPGMAWSADYYITLVIHYAAAAVFLGLTAYWLVSRAMAGRIKPQNGPARVRGIIFAALILSGTVLVLRNLSGIFLPPSLIVAATLTHIAGAMTFVLAAATYFRFARQRA